ncbi:MAG TPA: CHASE4 domain-containing protein, partial [Anaerolineae bacterium]
MSLRVKTLLISGILILALMTAIGVISYHAVQDVFSRLEAQIMRQDVARVLNALADRETDLDKADTDYAVWDDTYAFINNPNAEYIASNLGDNTLANLGLNIVILMQPPGNIVFAKGEDLNSETDVPVPADLLSRLRADRVLLQKFTQQQSATGIMQTSNGPMLVATHAILTSEGQGPRRGTLLMGRYLDAAETQQLAHTTNLQVDIYQLDQLPARIDAGAVQSMQQGMEIVVQPQDESTIAGFTLLADIAGEPAFVMHVRNVRTVYQEGQAMLRYFLTLLGLAILIYGVFTLIFLERAVLMRLARLSNRVVQIGAHGDFTERIAEGQSDELGKLAGAINKMLAALGDAHQALKLSERRYRSLIENSMDGIIVIDQGLMILYESPAVSRIFGYPPDVIFSRDYRELIHPDEKQRFQELLNVVLEHPGMTFSSGFQLQHKDGTWRYVEGNVTNWLDDPSIKGIVINFRDVTKRMRAEEQIRRQVADLTTLYAGAQGLAQSLDSLELAEDVARTCVETFGFRLARVCRAEPDGHVSLLAQFPVDSEYLRRITLRWDDTLQPQGPTVRAIQTSTPIVIDNVLSDNVPSPWQAMMQENGLHSGVALPLISRQRATGALTLYSDQPGRLTQERVQYFQSYALLAAAALENARLYEETERRLRHVQALHNIDTAIASNL